MRKLNIKVMILCLLIVIHSFGMFNVFAISESHSEVVLFETDFNNETAGSYPTTVKTPEGGNFTTTTNVVVCDAGTNGRDTKHIQLIQRVAGFFPESINSGQFYIEFDAMVNKGYLSVGLINTTDAKGKWIFGLSRETFDQLYTWKNKNANPPSNYSHIFVKKGTNDDLKFLTNQWQSYCLKVDVDNSAVTVFIDGEESATIAGYEYFGGLNPAITGVVFRNDFNQSEEALVYIDNIRIRKDEYCRILLEDDFENGTSKWYEAGTTKVIQNDTSQVGGTIRKGDAITTYNEYETITPADPDNMVFALNSSKGTGKTVYSTFSENVTGTFVIEAEFQAGVACLGIGLLEEGKLDDNKYIFYIPSANNTFCYSNAGNLVNAQANNTKYLKQGKEEGQKIDRCQWHTLKLIVNLTEGTVKPIINGIEMQETEIDYIQGKTICGIQLANNRDLKSGDMDLDHVKYVDNIKVYTVSDGKSISDIKTGSNKVKVTFKDAIKASTFTNSNIEIFDTNGSPKAIEDIEAISDTEFIITLTDILIDDTNYIISLSDDIEYADGSNIASQMHTFTYNKGSFTAQLSMGEGDVIQEPTGINATATCIINANDLSNRKVQLILAAYEGSKLTGVKIQEYQYDAGYYGQDELSINESFDINSNTIKAFIWDDNLVPYAVNAVWEDSN